MGSRVLRTWHGALAETVTAAFRSRCPCCMKPMRTLRGFKGRQPRDQRTVAHDYPVGFGGNPTVWVYACHSCNNEQDRLTFREWADHLEYMKDERATLVRALADLIDEWCALRGIERQFGKRVKQHDGGAVR